MPKHIAPKHIMQLAAKMWPNLKSLMHGYTWPECVKFAKRELEDYNRNGGYGAISDHFLHAAHSLGLD